jgi:hypothetical protein
MCGLLPKAELNLSSLMSTRRNRLIVWGLLPQDL